MSAYSRRSFINKAGGISIATFLSGWMQPAWSRNLQHALQHAAAKEGSLADDEDFWHYIQQAYTVSPGIINLNNGGVAPSPKSVQDAMKRFSDLSNEAPSYYMWRVLDLGREPLRKNLALLAGCDAEEIAIQRNATEALQAVIFGITLKKGDEVVLSRQDYPSMINAWKQREIRDGIKLVWVDLQLPSEDNSYLTDSYVKAFTSKTKVVQVTHVINWNGQILPVRKIADAAHQRGIQVLVDGAHSFAQFPFTIPELGADYFGTSLHKWLSACIGSGMLYVKKERIKDLYPLLAADEPRQDNIRKFEHLGTRPFFIEQAIGKAIEFHEMIGAQRKEERLLYLKNYWMSRVKDLPGVKLGTSLKSGFGCAIGFISIEGRSHRELEDHLMDNYKIHGVPIQWHNLNGFRITPNVYTSKKNLDLLVTAIESFVKK
jgi:selenocysteine lyase/cysteine desulfurase